MHGSFQWEQAATARANAFSPCLLLLFLYIGLFLLN